MSKAYMLHLRFVKAITPSLQPAQCKPFCFFSGLFLHAVYKMELVHPAQATRTAGGSTRQQWTRATLPTIPALAASMKRPEGPSPDIFLCPLLLQVPVFANPDFVDFASSKAQFFESEIFLLFRKAKIRKSHKQSFIKAQVSKVSFIFGA